MDSLEGSWSRRFATRDAPKTFNTLNITLDPETRSNFRILAPARHARAVGGKCDRVDIIAVPLELSLELPRGCAPGRHGASFEARPTWCLFSGPASLIFFVTGLTIWGAGQWVVDCRGVMMRGFHASRSWGMRRCTAMLRTFAKMSKQGTRRGMKPEEQATLREYEDLRREGNLDSSMKWPPQKWISLMSALAQTRSAGVQDLREAFDLIPKAGVMHYYPSKGLCRASQSARGRGAD